MQKYHFLSGLPRSGSTLLSSILNENPEIYASSNSPVCGLAVNIEKATVSSEQFKAYPKPQVIQKLVMGAFEGYYSDTDKPIILDKSRDWTVKENFGTLLRNLPYEPKVIITVRDILEVLASFINIVHKNPESISFIDKEIQARNEFNYYRSIDDIRCDHLMRPKGLIDNALYGIANAFYNKELSKNFLFIEYNDLVFNPEETLGKVYDFLEIEKFDHNLEGITNTVKEDDSVYGLQGLHDIREKLEKRKIDIEKVLSPYVISKYSNLEFWRNNATPTL